MLGCLSLYSSLLFWSPLVVLLLLSILSSDSMRGVPGGLGYLFLFLEKIFRSSLWTLGHTLQFGLLITPVSRGNLPRKMVYHTTMSGSVHKTGLKSWRLVHATSKTFIIPFHPFIHLGGCRNYSDFDNLFNKIKLRIPFF